MECYVCGKSVFIPANGTGWGSEYYPLCRGCYDRFDIMSGIWKARGIAYWIGVSQELDCVMCYLDKDIHKLKSLGICPQCGDIHE
jgi:hypothetical protein